MKKQQLDERVVAQRNKVASETLNLLIVVLWGASLVQQFIFDAPPAQYMVEFVLAIAACYYNVIRNMMLGFDFFSSAKNPRKVGLLNGILSGSIISIVNTAMDYFSSDSPRQFFTLTNLVDQAMSWVVAFAVSILLFLGFAIINEKRQKAIENKMDAEETDN